MNVALIPMSAKPYHAGHHKLIEVAADQNDLVVVYVSFSGRGTRRIKDPLDSRTIKQGARKVEVSKKGEVPIFGSDMKYIWEDVLLGNLSLPEHVRFIFPEASKVVSPIGRVHDACEILKESFQSCSRVFYLPEVGLRSLSDTTTLRIYSDTQDIISNYNNDIMKELYDDLFGKNIQLVGVSRKDTVDISGTKMRELILTTNKAEFKSLLPNLSENLKNIIVDVLFESARTGKPFISRLREGRSRSSTRNLPITSG
jgi:hypothetical protein